MLTRYVKGLPRYPMDCGWWRHPKFAGVTVETLFVFQAGISYGNEHATDGWLPADAEDLSLALGLKMRTVKPAVVELVKRGLWEKCGERLYIVGFGDHNATSEEAEAHADAKRHRAIAGNHRRWHTGPDARPNPTCPLCNDHRHPTADPAKDSHHESNKDTGKDSRKDSNQGLLNGSSKDPKGREGKGIPPLPLLTAPPRRHPANPDDDPDDDQGHDPARTLLAATWTHLAQTDLANRTAKVGPPVDPQAWLTRAAATRAAAHHADAAAWLQRRPRLVEHQAAAELARLLTEGDDGEETAANQAAATQAWLADPPDPGQRAAPPAAPPTPPGTRRT